MSVKITVEFRDVEEATAMYQVCKRFTYTDGERFSANAKERDQILDATGSLQRSLSEAGIWAR